MFNLQTGALHRFDQSRARVALPVLERSVERAVQPWPLRHEHDRLSSGHERARDVLQCLMGIGNMFEHVDHQDRVEHSRQPLEMLWFDDVHAADSR